MVEHSAKEMKCLLDRHTKYREKLYCRGFLLTEDQELDLTDYPFYGNWKSEQLDGGYRLYAHKDTQIFTYRQDNRQFFLVGHAYDPFAMVAEEQEILRRLSDACSKGEDAFWEEESSLTGIFFLGYVDEAGLVYTTDCTGMQLTYHGVVNGRLYITSHSKLVADLCGLMQDPYIVKLVNSRFYRHFGTVLPGDLSPYPQLLRLPSNHAGCYRKDTEAPDVRRYYPRTAIATMETEEEYNQTIRELSEIMSRTMALIARKWADKKVAISVTGGNDSKTTLASANGNYEHFDYFSYISNDAEAVDAYAAREICAQLNLPHRIYEIQRENSALEDVEVFRKIMECNAGCIGRNNANDVRKRLVLSENREFDLEVKSWVNEIGRARFHKRYNKKSFPRKPTASYCRTLYKIIFSPSLIRQTDRVFREYLRKYYSEDVLEQVSWPDLYYWEYVWGSGEGLFLTAEHKVAYDITIPFNNRRYLEKMLTVPLDKRIDDCIPRDIIAHQNRAIAECGIAIKDVGYTDSRTVLERGYLEIFSRIRF